MADLGAQVIDCDKLAHTLYQPGKTCYANVVETFGAAVVAENGEINRAALGGIVFGNPDKLRTLNSLIWPALAEEVMAVVRNSESNVVVIEAAVLLIAGWVKYCHEVLVDFGFSVVNFVFSYLILFFHI